MFFPERILSIKPGDRVLDVGPGGTPHPRADVLLERNFDQMEAAAQRGYAAPMPTDIRTVFLTVDVFRSKTKLSIMSFAHTYSNTSRTYRRFWPNCIVLDTEDTLNSLRSTMTISIIFAFIATSYSIPMVKFVG